MNVRFGADGLVPAVVQDAADGRVLMVAYMDAEALEATQRTGEVHFHSRSRGRLWRKGETSGNTLRVVGLELDCDRDAVLAASIFHRRLHSIAEVKRVMAAAGIPVRAVAA